MTANDFRRIALGFTGAIEGAHMGHPDFRAGGRIFATLHTGDKTGMVKLTPEQQQEFVSAHPEMFEPEVGAWGRQGCTRVHLREADLEVLGEAMTLAWQSVTAPRPSRARTLAVPAKTAKTGKTGKTVRTARSRTKSR
jgi:hypothetical protein